MRVQLFLIFVIVYFPLFLLSCDVNPTDSNNESSIKISTDTLSNSALKNKLSSFKTKDFAYSCSIQTLTLTETNAKEKFNHKSSIQFFSDRIVRKSNGVSATWSFIFTDNSSGKNWKVEDYDNVVKKAICNLPDVKGIENIMSERLMEQEVNEALSEGDSNIKIHKFHTDKNNSGVNTEFERNFQKGTCSSGIFCSEYFTTVVYNANTGEVYSITVECVRWDYYVYYCGDGSGIPSTNPNDPGSGGPPSGNQEDIEDPCNPSGPAQFPPPECMTPCEWMTDPPTWMCGDPCNTNDPILDDINVQKAMHDAWTESYGSTNSPLAHDQRNEAMFMVLATSSGYEIEEISPGPNTSSCRFDGGSYSVPSNIVALLHTHPYSDGDPINDPRCSLGVYDGDDVSDGDENLMQQFSSVGYNIPFYVIDKDKIRVIEPSDASQYDETINRCGY